MPRYRAASLILPGHPLHGRSVDLLVDRDRFAGIEAADGALDADRGDRDLGDAVAFAGWWDLQTDFRDPGTDRAEGLEQGLAVAAQGGFARVAPVASTRPCRDQPADIQSILLRSQGLVTGVIPVAALSAGRDGTHLTEAHALVAAGAQAFSDDAPVRRPELLRRALEYHGTLGTPVFSEAHDPDFQPDGLMHEGPASTRMGLPGLSEETETLRIRRDLDILRYSGGRLHIPVVTSATGIQSIRAAKADGLNVTCGTTVHHLCWTDEDLSEFNGDLKLALPLRAEADRDALRAAALDGTLDVVVSDHRPRTPEEHDADFMVIAPGIAGLHAVGPALRGALVAHGASADQANEAMARLLATGPRRVIGAEDDAATPEGITLFSPSAGTVQSASKAPNTVYGTDTPGMSGHVVGVMTPRGVHWN
ncbi:MAG: hypothetical protein ACPGYZ_04935 [Flavobacteriales bacterium]